MESQKPTTPTAGVSPDEHSRDPVYGVPKGIWDRVIDTLNAVGNYIEKRDSSLWRRRLTIGELSELLVDIEAADPRLSVRVCDEQLIPTALLERIRQVLAFDRHLDEHHDPATLRAQARIARDLWEDLRREVNNGSR